MKLTLKIHSADGSIRYQTRGEQHCELVWTGSYEPGDYIRITAAPETFARIRPDLLISPALVYLHDGEFSFEIPFGRAKEPYPQGAFTGLDHQLTVEAAAPPAGRYILSENPLDIRGESRVFPYCTASVETGGESVFAARNTIDGLLVTQGHGFFPYTSWERGRMQMRISTSFSAVKSLPRKFRFSCVPIFPTTTTGKRGSPRSATALHSLSACKKQGCARPLYCRNPLRQNGYAFLI